MSESDGILYVNVIEGRNLSAMDRGCTSDPYCVLKSTFNKQVFKTSVVKKNLSPVWNQQFKFYTTQLSGHISIRVWDYDRWTLDEFLGEVAISMNMLKTGDRIDEWFTLSNEPKKTKNKNPNKPPGELHLVMHYPIKKAQVAEKPLSPSVIPEAVPETKNGNIDVHSVYTFSRELGKGGFSVVYEGIHNKTKEKVAIKVIPKTASEQDLNLLRREIDIMTKLHHRNIIELIDVYDSPENIYLILELVTGGELFDQIINRGSYSECDAANIVKQILDAVQYMHSNGIAHRDLKPENLLVTGQNNEIIKVTDFGLSKDFGESVLSTSCGTPDYVAPEVLRGAPYDNSVDIWSIGIITYILLCGYPPFYGNNDQEIFGKILFVEYDFPPESWDTVSEDAKDFIRSILVLNSWKRLTAQEALNHPWLVGNASSSALSTFKKDAFEAYKTKRSKQRRKQ
ncbi:myosin light chain kinase A-like isoform X2 [Schistocerca gregaria]|uniref:myosin light chain kinase A-like isoform X2 n=1 Tax=Schistocerca gregaria TaxID=7010 RepID=UPI00211E8F67|nr:myosin light chain kinase A-like isoform X2 [Schistocerca gregaria]